MDDYLYPNARIAIFAKAPIPGTVKTRMQPALSEQQSALLQDKLITHSVSTCINSQVAPVQLWCAPDTQHPAFQSYGIELRQQQGNNLGKRMQGAFEDNHGFDFTLLIGTDCPLLSPEDIHAAALAVQIGDVCIAPAHDGGYVLIASKEAPQCFANINWGSEKVLSQSLSALASAEQNVKLLTALPDLDHPEDLAALPDNTTQALNACQLRSLAQNYLG